MFKKILLFSFILLFLASCATITRGSKQLVTINCNIDGADIYLDGLLVGETPFVGKVKKGKKIMTIEKEGYKTYSISLSKSLEGMFWGNIITGGTLGSITDFASGAAWAYAPSSFQVELIEDGQALNDFELKTNLKKFAMVHMSEISIDLSNNNGPHLESLIQLANLDGNSNDVEMIRNNLQISNGDQVAFGKLMVKALNI